MFVFYELKKMDVNKAFLNKDQKLLKVNEDLFELRLKAFNSQMNPHFIFNALNAIQYFITSGNKKLSLTYLSTFSKLIRSYLKHIEKETVNLADEIAMLGWYLKLQKLRYDDWFDYTINAEEYSKNIEAKIPSFILQTLFENIIEHTIYSQYKNYTVNLVFKTTKNNVSVSITYNYIVSKSKVKYVPNYRKQILKWEDQIRLLNNFKNYNIKKQVLLNKKDNLNGGVILLNLPNLR
jgi:LytS/YehU family sensor histidine kinase